MLLWEIENVYPQKRRMTILSSQKELIDILNKADITNLDWEMVSLGQEMIWLRSSLD